MLWIFSSEKGSSFLSSLSVKLLVFPSHHCSWKSSFNINVLSLFINLPLIIIWAHGIPSVFVNEPVVSLKTGWFWSWSHDRICAHWRLSELNQLILVLYVQITCFQLSTIQFLCSRHCSNLFLISLTESNKVFLGCFSIAPKSAPRITLRTVSVFTLTLWSSSNNLVTLAAFETPSLFTLQAQ